LQTYDALFRVNHRWLKRQLLTRPDAVFTGALDSVQRVGRDILYVFVHEERSMRIVMRARKSIPRLSFTNASDLGFPLQDFEPYQPTNGLIMLYLAVKLQPDHLTVAGIDLYRDPRGCYPDESAEPNQYTSAHDEGLELDMMLRLLSSYKGNLTIIGKYLATEYECYVQSKTDKN
jgi:hypothetical protein